jgi:hypothetical protein
MTSAASLAGAEDESDDDEDDRHEDAIAELPEDA